MLDSGIRKKKLRLISVTLLRIVNILIHLQSSKYDLHEYFLEMYTLYLANINFILLSSSVDKIEIPSKRGKGTLKRVSEVFDCWFESGSMPYAQKHYPFENKKEFEDGFPADFIAEGIDQTRGWYVLLAYRHFNSVNLCQEE